MTQCKLCFAISNVRPADKKAIVNALKYREITNVELATVMTNNGWPLSEASVRRHLNHKDN